MSDPRPWRMIKFRLPEDVAVYWEKALDLARIAELAQNKIQAIEAMAVEFCQTYDLENFRPPPEKEEQFNKFKAKELAGFRCIRCEHSKNLHVHHIIPKSYYGEDRPENINAVDNLACICNDCHEHVHANGWRHFVQALTGMKLKAEEQVATYGHRTTKKHGDRGTWL